MPTVEYPKNPNTDTAFVTDDGGKRTRSLKTVLVDGTIDYPKNANAKDCYVTIDGKKQRAMMTADISSEGTLEYADGSNSTKGYVVDGNGKKHRVILTAVLAGGGAPINNEDISVTTNGTYTAGEGYTGLGTVNVNVPNPSTGTKSITSNGVYDVTNYASADVNIPTAVPAHYIERTVNANGVIEGGSTVMDFTGLQKATTDYILAYIYYQNNKITGTVDLSGLKEVSGKYALQYAFYQCSGITSIDLSGLQTVSGMQALQSAFNSTAATSVDLRNLVTVSGESGLNSCFAYCTLLTSVNLSSLTTLSGQNALASCFRNSLLQSVTFDSLTNITGSYALNGCFRQCSLLTNIYFPAVKSTSFNSTALSNLVQNVTGCTIHFPSNLDPQGGSTVISSLSGYPNFGGTNTVLAFDLPATE